MSVCRERSACTRTLKALSRPARNQPDTISAQVEMPTGGAEGVLFAFGTHFGGQALYIIRHRPADSGSPAGAKAKQ